MSDQAKFEVLLVSDRRSGEIESEQVLGDTLLSLAYESRLMGMWGMPSSMNSLPFCSKPKRRYQSRR